MRRDKNMRIRKIGKTIEKRNNDKYFRFLLVFGTAIFLGLASQGCKSDSERKIELGAFHTCAIKQDGSLWCWGNNEFGQLGVGILSDELTPVRIIPSGIAAVSLGSAHTCAVGQDGSLWCWGNNEFGQLGDGTNSNRKIPVKIFSSGIAAVSLGALHTCAIKQDDSLWCWGYNEFGQLGDGTFSNRNTPVKIIPSGVSAVSLGWKHTCAIKQDNSLWCWGNNEDGQLGRGIIMSNTPTYVMNLGSGRRSLLSSPYIFRALRYALKRFLKYL